MFLKESFEERLSILGDIVEISESFISTALNYGRIIISEAFMPDHLRTVKPTTSGGQLGGRKYICRGILFKFAADDAGVFSNHSNPFWASMKVAGHELKGLKVYQSTKEAKKLCFPLCCTINFKGLKLVALTVLPVSKETICYGSDNAGTLVRSEDEQVYKLISSASKELCLAPHAVGPKGYNFVCFCFCLFCFIIILNFC